MIEARQENPVCMLPQTDNGKILESQEQALKIKKMGEVESISMI